jgi:gliding motility-associated lipoprotein GldH
MVRQRQNHSRKSLRKNLSQDHRAKAGLPKPHLPSHMKITFNILWVIGLISLLSSSCQSDAVFDQTESLAATGGWVQKKHIDFPFEIQDTLQSYDLRVAIRQSNDYPFYNLYFNCRVLDAQQGILKKGFAEAMLYDPKSGKPKGGGVGDMYSHSYTIFKGLKFRRPGKYHVDLEQYMRTDTLTGVVSIGASLVPSPH